MPRTENRTRKPTLWTRKPLNLKPNPNLERPQTTRVLNNLRKHAQAQANTSETVGRSPFSRTHQKAKGFGGEWHGGRPRTARTSYRRKSPWGAPSMSLRSSSRVARRRESSGWTAPGLVRGCSGTLVKYQTAFKGALKGLI